jgi:DNA-binding response OmpR family regulator
MNEVDARTQMRSRTYVAACKVLVVDDDVEIRAALSEVLRDEGYAVATAADGEQALVALRREPADLVLLDLMMPGVNGWQFLERKHKEAALEGVPVLIVSASNDQNATLLDKVVGRIPKPFNLEVLLARVREICPITS